MTTDAQKAANRANAARSTGPRSPAGKTRSSRNATRHGLSTPAETDPAWQERIAVLTSAIAGEGAPPDLYRQAQDVAAAQAALERVRRARSDLEGKILQTRAALARCLAAPRPHCSAQKHALDLASQALMALDLSSFPEGGAKARKAYRTLQATTRVWRAARKDLLQCREAHRPEEERARAAWSDLLAQLTTLDHYERRALSQRATATRHLDQARLKVASRSNPPPARPSGPEPA